MTTTIKKGRWRATLKTAYNLNSKLSAWCFQAGPSILLALDILILSVLLATLGGLLS